MMQTLDILQAAHRDTIDSRMGLLEVKEQQVPGSVHYVIRRYNAPQFVSTENKGMLVYHYSKNDPDENFFELRLENLKGVGDRNLEKFYAEVPRERPRVVDAAARRVRAWHGNTRYVLWTQRISCDDCGNSGINSAAQTDHYRVEVAFAAVIAEPERKRGKNLLWYFAQVKFDCRSRIRVDDSFVFTKRSELRDHIPR